MSDSSDNRLAGELSPYLRSSRSSPVDWYPWGDEALRRARQEDRPIFLSVGYSSCYWCHVMERQSFADRQLADYMNRHFVNIKVDREERPDVDEVYMAATQIYTHHGGWPTSLFLTPRLEPYFAGTFFAADDQRDQPGFATVLQGMAHAWQERRADVEEQARELAAAMRRFLTDRGTPSATPPSPLVVEHAVAGLEERLDETNGGFGKTPKFPSPAALLLLDEVAAAQPAARRMLDMTLASMARGGIYDQFAGGFHRHAVDAKWKVPQFDKMLGDNGLLLELYARWYARDGDPEGERVCRQTVAFLEGELSHQCGGFRAARDAGSEGAEVPDFAWTLSDLVAVLGREDAGFLAPIYGFDGPPFFERSFYVPHLPRSLAEQAERRRMSRAALVDELQPLAAKLLDARRRRRPPRVDDKVLADGNGLAIAGLATAGRLLGEPAWCERAARAAQFVLTELRPGDGPLHHAWLDGRVGMPAFLADYAYLGRGLLALHQATGDNVWLQRAEELMHEQIDRLAAADGVFFTAASADLPWRSKEIFDGALPSANATSILNLLELERRTGQQRWRDLARRALLALATAAVQQGSSTRMLALAVARYHATADAS